MAYLVQRGSQDMGSSTSVSVSLGTAIDTSKSFILISRLPITGGNSAPNNWAIEAYFPTTGSSISSFNLDRYGTTTGVTVYWQVVQMDNISVQHFNR